MNDPDSENKVKVKDIVAALEIYNNNIPPAEQVLSDFELTPVYTSIGVAYPSSDGTQAWIKNENGVHLVLNFNLHVSQDLYEHKPLDIDLTTQDIIEGYMQFGPQVLKNLPNTRSAQQGYKQIKVAESKLQKKLTDTDYKTAKEPCKMNGSWRAMLFWLLVMNFNARLDIVRFLIRPFLQPIERVSNWIISKMRKIKILFWHPFTWIPLVTWWEDLLLQLQKKEYDLMCSFLKFNPNLTLGTWSYGTIQYWWNTKIKHKDTRTKMLQAFVVGFNKYNQYCKNNKSSGNYGMTSFTKQMVIEELGPVFGTGNFLKDQFGSMQDYVDGGDE